MKILKLIIIFVLIILVYPTQAAVVSQTDDSTVIGGGARPLGMGRAFIAISDDVDGVFINPAGLASLKGPSAMSMFTRLLGEVYYYEYSGAMPAPFGTIGAGYISTGVNQIPTNTDIGIVYSDYYDSLFLLSYSTQLARFFGYGRNIFVGLNYKIFNRGFSGGANTFASGMSADFGIKYVINPYLSLGLCRKNFLPVSMGGVLRYSTQIEESISGSTIVGIAAKPVPGQEKVLLAFDVDIPSHSGPPVTLHMGGEWKIINHFVLRAGLDQSVDTANPNQPSLDPTCGISVDVAGFRFDYAYHQYYNDPELTTTYISISYTGTPWLALKGKVD